MKQALEKKDVLIALVSALKEVQQAVDIDMEILPDDRPASDLDYVDSEILVSITGSLAVELGVDIPKKCQLFIGENEKPLTLEEVANKILEINETNGSR